MCVPKCAGPVVRTGGVNEPPHLSGQRGSVLLIVVVLSVLSMLVIMATVKGVGLTTKSAGNRRAKSSLLNLCEAGKEDALSRLRSGTATSTALTRTLLIPSTPFGDGAYTVACSANADNDRAWLWCTGTIDPQSKTIEVEMNLASLSFDLSWIRGALSALQPVAVSGNCEVDGRDWDSTGSASPGSGLYGVSSCGSVGYSGSAAVGGYGIAPPDPKGIPAGTVESGADCTDFPATPEEVMGLGPNALDSYKMTAEEFNSMSFPFHGIAYVTESCGPVHCGDSRGILIVHNATSTASMHINQGDFKGLIIVDNLDKANGNFEIRGAVVLLANSGTVGNGSATIRYSSEVLSNLANYIGALTPTVTVTSWREL